ncbi:MAG: hypothetical protein Q4P24_18295, partial [Rhodobacterales bacterium]|nr:hypothetical protein [Rhodobacterales bacterium]
PGARTQCPNHSAPPLMAVLARCLRGDAVLCSDRDPACAFFARRNGVPHDRIDAKKGPFVINRAFHIQTINSLHDCFERFMEPFRGRHDSHPRSRAYDKDRIKRPIRKGTRRNARQR